MWIVNMRNRHQDVPSCRCQCGRRHGSYSLANKEQRCSLFTANMVGADMERKYFSGLTNIYASFYSHYTTWHCLFLPFSRFPEHDLARKMVKNAGSSTHKNGIQNESTKQLIGCQRLQWHNTTSKTERLVSGKRQWNIYILQISRATETGIRRANKHRNLFNVFYIFFVSLRLHFFDVLKKKKFRSDVE